MKDTIKYGRLLMPNHLTLGSDNKTLCVEWSLMLIIKPGSIVEIKITTNFVYEKY